MPYIGREKKVPWFYTDRLYPNKTICDANLILQDPLQKRAFFHKMETIQILGKGCANESYFSRMRGYSLSLESTW